MLTIKDELESVFNIFIFLLSGLKLPWTNDNLPFTSFIDEQYAWRKKDSAANIYINGLSPSFVKLLKEIRRDSVFYKDYIYCIFRKEIHKVMTSK